MKRLLLVCGLICTLCSNACALDWVSDLSAAMARAQKEKKAVLLDFTGSDWCPWCQKLKGEVFDRFEFAGYAAANLLMVEVDFPRHKKLSLEQLNANYALASKYGVQGYPTIVVLNADGQVLGQCGYIEGGPTAFIGRIERFPGMPHKGGYMVATPEKGPGTFGANSQPASVRPSPPAATTQAAVAPRAQYGELVLKGISSVGSRRMALINNETLMAGESAWVKSFNTNIEVTVKEIHDASVVVLVKGQTRELSLARGPGR